MKILTINVSGIPDSSSSNLIDAHLFQDYDVIVIDPSDLYFLYGPRPDFFDNRAEGKLSLKTANFINRINERRQEQIQGFMKKGGVLVCFMEPPLSYTYNTTSNGREYTNQITNYEWLCESAKFETEIGEIKYGKGTTIDYIDQAHPFAQYLKIKPSWSGYIDKDNYADYRIIASAYGTHVISLVKIMDSGLLIFIPDYYDHHNGELLKQCINELSCKQEIDSQPKWIETILVPGEDKLLSNIASSSKEIDTLINHKQTLIKQETEIEKWKWLLYTKGKQQLEPIVRNAFSLLGFTVELQPDKDSDGAIISEYGTSLLEIVGSKESVKIEKIGQLIRNIGNFITAGKGNAKGILVGNPFCEEPVGNRPPKDSQKQLFVKEIIDTAEQQNISVLYSPDLFEIVSLILENKIGESEKKALREKIFSEKGLIRLN